MADAYTQTNGDFGDVSGMLDSDQNGLSADSGHPESFPTPMFSSSSYTTSAVADGRGISNEDFGGPSLHAYARATSDGSGIGATAASIAEWTDTIRLDDGGDPTTLDRIPANYLANLYLGLHVEAQTEVSNGGNAEIHAGFDGFAGDATSTVSEHLVGTQIHDSVATNQSSLAQGTDLAVMVNASTGYADMNSTREVSIDLLENGTFYFSLQDASGNYLSSNPYNLRVISTKLNLEYPLINGHAALPGDFDGDDDVDASDYVAWRDGLGTTFTQGDYNAWRSNFGQSIGGSATLGTSGGVPEPSSLILVEILAAFFPHRTIR
jgi:hypothetical protein